MKISVLVFIALLTTALFFSNSDADWLFYHKPEFKGKIIDAETKAPIEGVVVVVAYEKHTLVAGPGGGYSTVIKAKETLTDEKGEFYFPSYTTMIQPLSKTSYATFTIYKPGYIGFPSFYKAPVNPLSNFPENVQEPFFSEGPVGRQGAIREGDPEKIYKVTFGVVELPKVTTDARKQRADAIPEVPYGVGSKELPLLYRAINEERKALRFPEFK